MTHPTSDFARHCRTWRFTRRDRAGYAWLLRDNEKVCRPHITYTFGAFAYTVDGRTFDSAAALCDAYATTSARTA